MPSAQAAGQPNPQPTQGQSQGQITAMGQWYDYRPPYRSHEESVMSGYADIIGAQGAYQHGFADVVRSSGEYNLMTSEAMMNVEDARKKYIDNRVYGTEKYFEMRDINRRARAAERGPRPTMEDAIRYANIRKPNRLSPSELDPLSGDITWPAALQQEQYRESRDELDKIYAERSEAGYLSADQLARVDSLTKSLLAQLKDNLRSYPPQLYTQAKSFLQSLAYESFLRPG